MEDDINVLSRRTLFLAGGLGAIAAATLATPAEADAPAAGDAEKANVKLVSDFCKSWAAKDFDADKMAATYLSDDSSVRMEEGKPALTGPAAVAAGFKTFTSNGGRVKVKILQTFAKGPVVVNSRVDTLVNPGKPDQPFKVAGVFIVKDGKIKEWSDYLAG